MAMEFNHGVRVIDAGTSSRPLAVADASTIGLNFIDATADNTLFPMHEPVLFYSHEVDKIAKLGSSAGNLAVEQVNAAKAQGIEVCIVAARVPHSLKTDPAAKAAEELANLVGSAGQMTGAHALSYAEGHVGRSVDIFTGGARVAGRVANAKNPYADALDQVSRKVKGIFVADTGGPDAESSLKYRADFSSRYGFLVDPFVRVQSGAAAIVAKPASPFVAAMFAKRDTQKGGPYFSPSNQEVAGILGTARPITYFDGELQHEANNLNKNGIATFIPARIIQNRGGAYAANGRILWGNRTTSTDPLWQFVNVVRTRAAIEKAIVSGFRPWASDENISAQQVIAVMRALQDLIDSMIALGAILGGAVYFERAQNTNASIRQGKIRIEFDAEEAPPMEDLIFGSRRNEAYIDNLAANIQRRVSVEFGGTIADYLAAA